MESSKRRLTFLSLIFLLKTNIIIIIIITSDTGKSKL